jgi:EpsI family protein
MPNVTPFIPAAILAGGLALLAGTHEQQRPSPVKPLSGILNPVEGYTFTATEVDTNSQRVAGMDEYVARVYRLQADTTKLFTLYIGYYQYQSQGHTIHSPRNCLPGAGWEPVETSMMNIPGATGEGSLQMNKYVLANKGAYAGVYYWYQGRGRIESNEYTVKLNLLRDAAVHGRTEESLVRLVIPLDTRENRDPTHIKQEIAKADSLALSLAPRLAREVGAVMPVAPGT